MTRNIRLLMAISLLLASAGVVASGSLGLGTWLMEAAAEEGRPDSPKYDEAFRLLRPLATAGNAEAEFRVATLYAAGLGSLQVDFRQAAALMKSAADKGLPKAQIMMGHYHEKGVGVRPEQDSALVWYRRAAQGGHPMAIARLVELDHTSWSVTEVRSLNVGTGVPAEFAEDDW